MKIKNLSILLMMGATFILGSCTADEGTMEGGDSNPVLTLYQYTAPENPDNDVFLRVAVNNKVEAGYYLTEKQSEYENRLKSLGEAGYAEYVVTNGKKIDNLSASSPADVIVKGLIGQYAISTVAVGGGQKLLQTKLFEGLEWEQYCVGTFHSGFFSGSWEQVVLKAKGKNRYRLPDCFTEGYNFDFTMDGKSVGFTKQETGYVHKTYGMVSFGEALNGTARYGQDIVFYAKFTVSAGSFGEYEEYITVPEGK